MDRIEYPGGRFLQFAYDAGGRRIRSQDQSGFQVNYSYDSSGRLDQLRDGDDTLIVDYTYDSESRLIRKDLGNGTWTSYGYDAAGQLTSVVHRAPDDSVTSRFDYEYDALGRRTRVTTLEGITKLHYDAIGQLTHVDLPGGRVLEYAYDAAGNRTRATDNGVVTSYASNELNQYSAVGNISYRYDADGNLIEEIPANGPKTAYVYDDENRLVGQSGGGGVLAFQFDALGQRSVVARDGVRTNYLIDPTNLGDVVGEFDSSGAPIARYTHGLGLVSRVTLTGAAYYNFDAQGNTAAMTDATGAVVNRYSYLPFGQTTVLAAALPNPFTFVGQYGIMHDAGAGYFMRARTYDAGLGQFRSNDPTGLFGGDFNFRRYVNNDPINGIDPSGLHCVNAANDLSTLIGFGGMVSASGTVLANVSGSFGSGGQVDWGSKSGSE